MKKCKEEGCKNKVKKLKHPSKYYRQSEYCVECDRHNHFGVWDAHHCPNGTITFEDV